MFMGFCIVVVKLFIVISSNTCQGQESKSLENDFSTVLIKGNSNIIANNAAKLNALRDSSEHPSVS